MHLTIRQRILFTFTLIFVIGGLVQLYIAGSRLQAASLEFFEHNLETQALAAAGALGGSMESITEGEGRATFDGLFNLQRHTDTRYAVIDPQYHILASSVDHSDMTTMPQTDEIRDAERRGVGSDIRNATLYVAAPIIEDSQTRGFLVLWASLSPAYADAQRQWLALIISTLPVLGLGIIGSLWIGRTISHPIQQLHTSALDMANGKMDTRIVVESKDEIGELAHAFNFMAGRLEDLISSQRNFVSHAAHELRTPLMNMKLRVEALQDADLPTVERDAYLSELNVQIEHMAHMVTSLLTLARLDEGRHPTDNLSMDTGALLHDIARNWRIQAQKAGLTFHEDIPENLSEIPVSDADLRIVLDNVFSNAVKYTKQGQITFVVAEDAQNFTLKVMDTGTGFTPAEGARLFERFFRADTLRTLPGTGLGLSIVQAIATYYSGTVRASSEGVGLGTTIEVLLPKERQKAGNIVGAKQRFTPTYN